MTNRQPSGRAYGVPVIPPDLTPVRFAPVRSVPDRFASVRFASVRFAPVRFKFDRFAPVRFKFDRFAPGPKRSPLIKSVWGPRDSTGPNPGEDRTGKVGTGNVYIS